VSRLVVISNRVSAPKARTSEATQGGLASALSSALRKSGGMWCGWSGGTTDRFSNQVSIQRNQGVTFATVDLEPQDVEEYYNGYANRTLWPLFHQRIDLAEFNRHFGQGYERANERFARVFAPLIDADDLLWVHDYHLIPLGSQLRRLGVSNRIGFFLHVPWPPHGLMTALPFHRRLVESMLAYDLIGFQTRESLESFIDYLEREFGVAVEDGALVRHEGRVTRIGAFPIGVDPDEVRTLLERPDAEEAFETLRRVAGDRKCLLGVDRLDYSKGLAERFHGYRAFLEDNPEWVRRLFLLQVAPLSREDVDAYAEIRAELDGLSGHINGQFAHVDWVPIHYVNQSYPRDSLMGLYRAADVALVTPLRDGMNLVAKEYVAAQDPDDPGVLILSRFAGAAEQMAEALLVNPHSKEDLADAIGKALVMPRNERVDRWRQLFDNVQRENVHHWLDSFLSVLSSTSPEPQSNGRPLSLVS
jgi:trehalose 6-phosphate synthase